MSGKEKREGKGKQRLIEGREETPWEENEWRTTFSTGEETS